MSPRTMPTMGPTLFEILGTQVPFKGDAPLIFELILDDLNFRGEKRAEFNVLSPSDKWAVVSRHLLGVFKRITDPYSVDDLDEIEKIKGENSVAYLESLEILLRTRPISWLGLFIDKNGLIHLVDGLENSRKCDSMRTHEEMYIRCLKALMNNKIGLEAVFGQRDYLKSISRSLWSQSKRAIILVLEILGAVCLIPGGRSNVLNSLECLSFEMNTRSRFDIVLRIIGSELCLFPSLCTDLLVACMSFINVMVSGALEDNLGLRMYFRSEFEENGINRLIKKLSRVGNDLLDKQLDIWERASTADSNCAFSGLHLKDLDKTRNVDDMLLEVKSAISKLGYEPQLYIILRNLLLIQGQKRNKELAQIIAMLSDSIVSKPEFWLNLSDPTDSIEGSLFACQESVIKKNIELESTIYTEIGKNKTLEEKNAKLSGEINELRVRIAGMESAQASSKLKHGIPTDMAKEIAQKCGVSSKHSTFQSFPSSPSQMVSSVPPPPSSPFTESGPPPPPSSPFTGSGPPPPPSSPFTGSGPPPPPSSPFTGSGLPPPPSGGSRVMSVIAASPLPPKLVPKSEKKLKPMNWVKIPSSKARTTVWSEIDDNDVHEKLKNNFYKKIEDVFQVTVAKAAAPTSQIRPITKKLSFLDPRRSQNCSIMLRSIKLTPIEIANLISVGDFTAIPSDSLVELIKHIPTKEEVDTMRQHENDINDFADPDRLLWELSKISYCKERVDTMILRKGFSESCDYIENTARVIVKACEEVKESKKLMEVLKIALALGNYLNSQSRGVAYGFRISGLLRLGDMRAQGTGRKSTLLHFFAELLNEQYPDIADFPKEVPHVQEASSIQLPHALSMLESLKVSAAALMNLLSNLGYSTSSSASVSEADSIEGERTVKLEDESEFVKNMAPFHSIVESRTTKLEDEIEYARKLLRSLASYYAEDPKIMPSEFFGIFATFFNMYRSAAADVLLASEAEKKKFNRSKMNFSKVDAHSNTEEKGPSIKGCSKGKGNDQHLEDLISSIRTVASITSTVTAI